MKNAVLIIDPYVRLNQEITVGLSRELQKHEKWHVHVISQDLPTQDLRRLIRDMKADAIISRHRPSDLHLQQEELSVPVVIVVPSLPSGNHLSNVVVDDEAIGKMAADYLLAQNFEHLAVVDYAPSGPGARIEVFSRAVERSGRCLNAYHLNITTGVDHPFARYSQPPELIEWLKQLPKPCAIFAYSDQPGGNIIEACVRNDIKVPEEVSVLGVDDDPLFCHTVMPNLASIRVPYGRIGVEAARLILDWKPGRREVKVGPATVVERASCRPPQRGDELVDKALEYVRENSAKGVRVRDLQKLTGLTSHQLVYRFNDVTGRAPMEMILRQRIARAKELLAETALPAAEVALSCGFKNANRFYVTFRDQVGMSPRDYRAQFTL